MKSLWRIKEKNKKMANKEAFTLIGEGVEELINRLEVQKKMMEICSKTSKEAAEQYVYTLAIATLCGA